MRSSRLAALSLFVIPSVAMTIADVALPAVVQAAPQAASPAQSEVAATPAERSPLDAAWPGAWIGGASAPNIPGRPPIELPVTIVVEGAGTAATAPSILMTVIPAGAVAKPAIDVVADGKAMGFTLDGGSARARFAAQIAEDGRSASGSCMLFNEKGEPMPPALDLRLRRVDLVSELPEQRVYAATLEAAGQKLAMRLALADGRFGPAGAFEIAAQGLRDFAVLVDKTEKGFRVSVPVGATATLDLAAQADGAVLEGTFAQGSFSAPIRFELQPGVRLGTLRRPQDPVPPFPYAEKDVRIAHRSGHALSATLTIPDEQSLARNGRLPAVVLVSGSGPQDRDEALMGHRPFLVIADALARAGVAVLRYDDRGVARSTGDFEAATTLDFASDAEEAVRWLKAQPAIDPLRVGIIGHSEGGLIAPITALWCQSGAAPEDPLAFLVLLAGTAEQGGKLLTRQAKALYDAAGVPAEKSGPALEAHAAAMAAMVAGKSGEELRPYIEEMVRKQVAIATEPLPDDTTLKPTFDAAFAQVSTPWMREFIRFDPRLALSLLEIPTLAMCGSKDLQVDMATNLDILDEVARASGAPIETRRLDGLNHLFQPAVTGVVDEYGTIDTTFDQAALAAMVAWIVEKSSQPKPAITRPTGWQRPPAVALPKRPEALPASEAPAGQPTLDRRRRIGSGPTQPASGGTP